MSGGDNGLLGARWRGGGEGICPGDSLVNAESGDPGISSPLLNLGGDGISVGEGEDGMSGLLCCKTGRSTGERGCFLRRRRCRDGLDIKSGGGDGICPGDRPPDSESGESGISLALLTLDEDGISVGEGGDGMSDLLRRRMGRSTGERGCFLRGSRCRVGLGEESELDEDDDDDDEDLGTLLRVLVGVELSELDEELCDLRNRGEGRLSLVFCMGKGGGEGDSSPEDGDETGDGASFLVLCSTGGESDMGIGVRDLGLPPGVGDKDSSL